MTNGGDEHCKREDQKYADPAGRSVVTEQRRLFLHVLSRQAKGDHQSLRCLDGPTALR